MFDDETCDDMDPFEEEEPCHTHDTRGCKFCPKYPTATWIEELLADQSDET